MDKYLKKIQYFLKYKYFYKNNINIYIEIIFYKFLYMIFNIKKLLKIKNKKMYIKQNKNENFLSKC